MLEDLIWAIASPSLLNPETRDDIATATWADESVDPEPLASFLADRSTYRVGAYFENLIHYWLEQVRKVELVAHGRQIQDGKQTLGELDFLFRDEDGQLTHWETAVKFFLHYPQENPTGSFYIGPNAADTLERKTQKLFEHQLPLSQRISEEIQQRKAFVKGRIFYHPRDEPEDAEMSNLLAPNHLRGIWIRDSELEWLEEPEIAAVRVLHKPHWLSERPFLANGIAFTSVGEAQNQLRQHFAQSNHPNLIGLYEEAAGEFVEVNRVFVVHRTWPESPKK
ncbi:MAG: DUF1853 family protein [Verrucomicrobiota bacterium]